MEENSVTRTKKYEELSATNKIQANCDLKETNIILQGLTYDVYSLVNHHKVAKDQWERVQLLMQGEGHMARQCPKPKRKRDATWFRDKVLLVEAQGSGKVLNDEELEFLVDLRVAEAKAILMVNLSSYGSDVLSEANKDNLIVNESLSAELERYKEQVKLLEEIHNVDLSTREKLIMDDIIREKNAQFTDFEKEINYLKQTISDQSKEKELLTKTFNVFKNESKEKEAKNIDKEISLEKKVKELDNIVCKMGQSAQTVHMLTKPQIRPMLYDGSVIAKETNVISIADSEETLMLGEESRSKMLLKQSYPMVLEKKVNIKPINYAVLYRLSKDFDILNEITEVQSVFNQMEATVQQYHVDKQCFEIQKKQFLIENDRLLDQIISQDIMNIFVNSSLDRNTSMNVNSIVAMNDSVNYVEMCNKCLELEAELIKQHNMLLKHISDPNHLIGECPKPPKDKNQRAFIGGSWSDSCEEDDEKVKDKKCLITQASNEICLGVDLEPDKWIKDSGCSKHMTGNQKLFSSYKAYNGGNVIFGSNLHGNIIGKGQIYNNKCRVTLSEHDSEITKDGKVISRGCTIVSIRTNHGREFDNEVQFGEFCNANGITHNFSAPRTPQSNGVVERKNRTLQEMSRTILNEQPLPQKFWCNAIDTSTYILNRILIKGILGKTPYELLRGRKHTLDYFRVFRRQCFILNTKDYLTKFNPKSYEGVFLGYSQNSKAYIILNKHTRKVEESLNVTFDETPPPSKTSPLGDNDLDEEEAIKVTEKKNFENDIEDETLEIDKIVNIKKSRNHPLENVIGNLNQITLRSQAQNQSNFFCFISTIEPKNVNKALTDESWIVIINKLDENGIVSRNKARLVAQGYIQQEGIDYDETYASVARLESIRILLGYACALYFKLFQMDVKSAFLNGFINEEKQTALAISTTEVKYVSARKACQQALWMKQALIDYDKGHISIEKVPSIDNVADILTKSLKRESFNYLRLALGMMEHIP
ncbi:retrovirus-related pol polyprotein from transposon TNT 1-94 [Tanacetum coccineum]